MPDIMWENICNSLKTSIGLDAFERWIASTIIPIQISESKIVLSVDNTYLRDKLVKEYQSYIISAAQSIGCNQDVELEFEIKERQFFDQEVKSDVEVSADDAPKNVIPVLTPELTFDTFVTGPSNLWAWTVTKSTAEHPGTKNAPNPLFIYGPTGVGKTHLLQSAGNYALGANPAFCVTYTTSEALLNEYIEACGKHDMGSFRARYRVQTDMLLIDDIQFLAGKKQLQEEFFNLFNELDKNNKQIIMTSDRAPKELNGLDDRLVSRFQKGLTTELEYPNFETRLAILRFKQLTTKTQLADPLLTFIAENVKSNVRALEGALTCAIRYTELSPNTQLTVTILRSIIKNLISTDDDEQLLSCEVIMKTVTEHFNVSLADLVSTSRTESLVLPRQIAMFLCRKLTNASTPEIAKNFSKKHSTIIYACKTITADMKNNTSVRNSVYSIANKLGKDLPE